jgi:hypothetical protein
MMAMIHTTAGKPVSNQAHVNAARSPGRTGSQYY